MKLKRLGNVQIKLLSRRDMLWPWNSSRTTRQLHADDDLGVVKLMRTASPKKEA